MYPQVKIPHPDGTQREVDEELALLLTQVWDKGLATDGCNQGTLEGEGDPAWIVFSTIADAGEFLLNVAHTTNYRLGDNVAMTIFHPEGDATTPPRGKVSWVPSLTPYLVKVWS